jgi:hypothetical protein
MKVAELRAQLEQMDDEDTLMIGVRTEAGDEGLDVYVLTSIEPIELTVGDVLEEGFALIADLTEDDDDDDDKSDDDDDDDDDSDDDDDDSDDDDE